MQNHNGSFNNFAMNATDPHSGRRWRPWMGAIIRAFGRRSERTGSRSVPGQVDTPLLNRGWIIANHKDQGILIIGDDLVTTKDSTIKDAPSKGSSKMH